MINHMTPKFLITVLTILCCSSARAFNADNAAKTVRSNGTATDTQAAINYANGKNQDGWVVTIGEPGGSYVWSAADLYVIRIGGNNTITLQGASPTNRPTISIDTAFGLNYAPGKLVTVKDIIFTENPPGRSPAFFVGGSGPTPGFRFTNVRWQGVFNSQLFVIGNPGGNGGDRGEGPYGLFDNCSGDYVTSFIIYNNNGGTDGDAVSPSWRQPIEWGTEKAVYFEDCDFRNASGTIGGTGLIDPYNGGSVVFRYNRVENIMLADHGADHYSNRVKSVLKHEIMHNQFYVTNGYAPWLIFFRGGTAAIFDNTFNSAKGAGATQGIYWNYFRANASAGPANSVYDRWYSPLATTITAASNGQTLPQATINVVDTASMTDPFNPVVLDQPATYIEGIKVTTSAGVQTVNCGGKTATTFTGCTGGTGTMSTGGAVTRASDYGTTSTQQPGSGPIFVKVAAGSNGAKLPQGTINVDDTIQFPSNPGLISVNYNWVTGLGVDVTCTGKTATTFTGCTGGTGTLATGQPIADLGQDPRHPTEPWGRMPIWQWNNRSTSGTIGSPLTGQAVRDFVEPDRDIFIRDAETTKPANTGTWLDSYRELEYPHPLRRAGAKPPKPPSNLRVQP